MIMPTKDQQLVALNSDGGWMMGGGTKDWLFAAEPAAQEARLSVEAPALWAQIQASPSGQFEYQGQCHYYRWYQFKQREKQSPRLLVAQRFQDQDCGYMANSAVKTWATQLALTSAFALPLLLLWNLSRARERELRHQLLQSNVQLDLVTREADLGLIMVDHQCRVCWANPEAKRFLGWKAADLIGENLHKRIHINRLLNFSPTPSAIGC